MQQGCTMSPILFLMAIDWVSRKTTADKARGIQWTLFSQLEDLDFADDFAVLSSKYTHLQEKTDRLNQYAKQTGLNISTSKTQAMCINAAPDAPIMVDEETNPQQCRRVHLPRKSCEKRQQRTSEQGSSFYYTILYYN